MRARILDRRFGSRNASSSPSFQGVSERRHFLMRLISLTAFPTLVAWKPVLSMDCMMASSCDVPSLDDDVVVLKS